MTTCMLSYDQSNYTITKSFEEQYGISETTFLSPRTAARTAKNFRKSLAA